MKQKATHEFAVKRGPVFTKFSTSTAAMAYNAVCLGSMLMIRTTSGWKNFY